MSFFKKTPVPPVKIEPEIPVEPVKVPEPVKPKPAKFEPIAKTTIGKGITFIGNFETKDPMELNGSILGDIDSSDLIKVSQTGSYKGNANMRNFELSGDAEGTIDCIDLTKFTSTATMTGNLTTARLVTDDGSSFIGDMKLQKNRPAKAAAPAAEANASGAASQAKTAADPAPAPAAKEEPQDSFEKAARAAEWAASEFEAIQKASELLEKDLADADADIPVDEDFLFSKK